MTSAFFGLDIALRALRAQQILVDVTNHNIANANTPGYSRQTGTLKTTLPFPIPAFNAVGQAGQLGSGVEVAAISRARDSFTDYQLRNELAAQGRADVRRDALAQVEAVFNEPSTSGLSNLLGKYWQAWQEVANSPSDRSVRANLVQQAQTVADAFHRTRDALTTLQRDVDQQVRLTVRDVNGLADRIGAINAQIANVETAGLRANDLRDERDLLVDELSKLARVTYQEAHDGTLSVYLGSRQLIDRTTVHHLDARAEPDEPFVSVVWEDGGQPAQVQDGRLKGLQELLDPASGVLATRLKELDAFAARLIESVNGVHVSGVTLDGQDGVAFFEGSDAATIGLAVAISSNPDRIAAARRQADGTFAPADGSNALGLVALQQSVTQRALDALPAAALTPGESLLGGAVLGVDLSRARPGQSIAVDVAPQIPPVFPPVVTFTVGGKTIPALVTSKQDPVTHDMVVVVAAQDAGVRITLLVPDGASPDAVVAGLAGRTLVTAPSATSLGDQYAAQIAALGVDARAAKSQSTNQEVLVNHLTRRRDETSAVSLDEETTNLIRYQHAYQAAARAMSAVDQMLDRLINGTGRVGL